MHFEWTVNIGNLLTAAGLFIGFYAAHVQNIKRLASIEEKVDLMFRWFTRRIINNGLHDED